jgi:hypothetical protein
MVLAVRPDRTVVAISPQLARLELRASAIVILGSGDIGLIMARRFTLEGARVNAVPELMPYLTGVSVAG